MKTKRIASLSSIVMLGLAACGGGGTGQQESNLSKEEAERAFDATASRTQAGTEQAENSSFWSNVSQFQGGDINIDMECTEGGSAGMTGNVSVPDDSSGAAETEMAFEFDFQSCGEDGVTVDGNLAYWTHSVTDENGLEMSVTMDGQLDYSGDIEESCAMDVAVNVKMDFSGGFESFDIDVEATGSFCGYDINELDLDATDPDNFEG